ncbi:hypothetical protein [Vulcanisaeta souniana]|uniref:hypothetical protein n=1 Tax=Vulcanisaeta souniana TaxID=164452 RepID=UPI001FB2C373|nr:hypothetical protein [Vulcanisaeta souniana]
MRISKRSSAFPGSAIRGGINEEVVKLEQSGVKVYGFHIGQPGLPPVESFSWSSLRSFSKSHLSTVCTRRAVVLRN